MCDHRDIVWCGVKEDPKTTGICIWCTLPIKRSDYLAAQRAAQGKPAPFLYWDWISSLSLGMVLLAIAYLCFR